MRQYPHSLAALALSLVLVRPAAICQTAITDIPVPTPLSGMLDADVYRGSGNRIHIVGTANGPASGYWDEYRLLFVVSRDAGGATSTATFPDTAWRWNDGLHGEEYRFNRAVAVDVQDNVFMFWSKQYAMLSDIPPFLTLGIPAGKCMKRTPGGTVNLFDLGSSTSPAVALGPDNTAHFAWETIESVRGDSNFVAYSSRIYYRYLTGTGTLSVPQFVDTGFSPRLASGTPARAHLVWMHGDSSTGASFSLRYRTIDAGIPSPAITLKDLVNKPAYLTMGVDSSGVVHVAWTEVRAANYIKVFLLSLTGPSIHIDSSAIYDPSPGQLRMSVLPNGIVNMIWAAGGGFDSLYYTSTRTLPPFAHVRSFLLPPVYFANALGLFTKSGGSPGCILGDASRIRYLRDLESGSDTSLVMITGVLPHDIAHPVIAGAGDSVWVAYRKSGSQLGLARFVDGTVDVHEGPSIVRAFHLDQNYPNPFNPSTTIRYSIGRSGMVTLRVLDILGEEVATLLETRCEPGNYAVSWDAGNKSSGVYFCKMVAGDFVSVRKMLVVK